jgi:hypothetical protein
MPPRYQPCAVLGCSSLPALPARFRSRARCSAFMWASHFIGHPRQLGLSGLSPRPARRGSVPPFSSGVMEFYDCSCGPIQCGPCARLPPRRRARREHPPLAVIDHSAADRETGPWRSERLILSSRHFHSLGHVLSLRWHVDPYRLSPSAPDLLVTCVLLVVSWSRRGGGATLAGDPRDLPFAALGIGKGRAEVPGKTTCAGQLALRFSGVPPNGKRYQRRRADSPSSELPKLLSPGLSLPLAVGRKASGSLSGVLRIAHDELSFFTETDRIPTGRTAKVQT